MSGHCHDWLPLITWQLSETAATHSNTKKNNKAGNIKEEGKWRKTGRCVSVCGGRDSGGDNIMKADAKVKRHSLVVEGGIEADGVRM